MKKMSNRIVSRCPKCNIILYNQSDTCPLCHCVVSELEGEEKESAVKLFGGDAPYPDVQGKRRRIRSALNIMLIIFIIAEIIMIQINDMTSVSYPWSLITGVSLLYIYLSLIYWLYYDAGSASKVALQLTITMLFLFSIDYFNGMTGWSLQWAIPGLILLGDLIVAVLMLVNRSRWQSYLLLLLYLAICSFVTIVLYMIGHINTMILAGISEAVTCLYLVSMILLGGRKAEREIKRRFHI